MRQRGYRMPPSERELVAVCARQRPSSASTAAPCSCSPRPPASACARVDRDRDEVVRVDHLEASDVVGGPLVHGSVVVVDAAADSVVDETRQLVDWEALGSTPSASA